MRSVWGFLFVMIACPSAFALDEFCVQHFNAYGPVYATQIKGRTQRFTKELMSESNLCEVIQFNEVWMKPQIQLIQASMKIHYQIEAPNLSQRNGLMSLFVSPVESSQVYAYPVNKASGALERIRGMVNVKKAFLVTQTRLSPNSEPLFFVNTHLHPTSQIIRIAQIIDLFQWRMRNQDLKLILSGDFNFNQTSLERRLLLSLLAARDSLEESFGSYPENSCTYCEENPRSWLSGNQVLDYIFYSNVSNSPQNLSVRESLINLKGLGRETYSDHYGVRTFFKFSPFDFSQNLFGPRQELLKKSLREASEILASGNSKNFRPYQNLLEQVSVEIEKQSGLYWEYISRYR